MSYKNLSSGIPTQRTTEWGQPRNVSFRGAGFLDFLSTDEDAEIAALEDPTTDGFKDPLAPPKTTPVSSPPKATPSPFPPNPTGGPNNVIAAPPGASNEGLSTMTLIGGGLAAVAVVGGIVWYKKKGGKRG